MRIFCNIAVVGVALLCYALLSPSDAVDADLATTAGSLGDDVTASLNGNDTSTADPGPPTPKPKAYWYYYKNAIAARFVIFYACFHI